MEVLELSWAPRPRGSPLGSLQGLGAEGGGTARRAQGTLPARGLGAPGAFGSPWLCHSSLMGNERLIFSSPTG